MSYSSIIPKAKYGNCSQCGAKNTDCVKKGKELWCIQCNERFKAEQQIEKAKKRTAARNAGFKLRNLDAPERGTEEYFAAERQALINDLDFVFSRIVRITGSDVNGLCSCYTCPLIQHWSMQQCGHFVKRGNTQIRWDVRNAKPQCRKCNETLSGNLEIYEQHLELEHPGLPAQLKELAREPYKWTRDELKQLLLDLRAKLKIIETKFNKPINT